MENSLKYLDVQYINDCRLKLLSDGKLSTEDGCVFDIHKCLLARSSNYFNALFCGIGKDKEDILIPGIRGDILREILSFIYTGSVSFRDENASELLIAADYLLQDDLLSNLGIILRKHLSVENSLCLYTTAYRIRRYDILWECYRFVQTHFECMLRSNDAGFEELSLECLKHFLRDRNLCVSNEEIVFSAIVKWVTADKFNRQHFVPDLLMCLAKDGINERLASMVLEDDVVMNNPACQFIIDTKRFFTHVDNSEILQNCLYDPDNFNHRLPTKLNCIASYSARDARHIVQFHVSYDEDIDLWRKVLEIEFVPNRAICVDDSIYMFRRGNNRNLRYSITEDRWYELNDFAIPRHQYVVVVADGEIYALGGISDLTGEEIYDVEIYDPHFDVWFHRAPPMIPIFAFCAVPLYSSIYVVGCRLNMEEEYEMIAQVYDTASESWTLLPAVSVARSHFAVVAYREKVYVIGGRHGIEMLKDVDMFDPLKNEWKAQPHLPYTYNTPRAVVIDDVLIAYDNHRADRRYMKTYPPVFWNTENETWEQFEESSPMNYLYLYEFLTVDNRESIAALTVANRNPGTCFEKSPFA